MIVHIFNLHLFDLESARCPRVVAQHAGAMRVNYDPRLTILTFQALPMPLNQFGAKQTHPCQEEVDNLGKYLSGNS